MLRRCIAHTPSGVLNYVTALLCRVVGDVMAGVVTKCLNARPKTKEASVNICLMCIEIEKQEVVQVCVCVVCVCVCVCVVCGCVCV